MRIIRLTNLGNLTLNRLQNLSRRFGYKDRLEEEKAARLSRFWPDRGATMWGFTNTFNTYQFGQHCWARRGAKVVPVSTETSRRPPWGTTDTPAQSFDVWEQMGLIETIKDRRPLSEIAREIQQAASTNPIRHVDGVVVELTGLCNLACDHCFEGKIYRRERGLPVDVIKEALRPLLMAGVRRVTFSGGEPTLRRKDLFELIEFVSDYLLIRDPRQKGKVADKYGTATPGLTDVFATKRYAELLPNGLFGDGSLSSELEAMARFSLWEAAKEELRTVRESPRLDRILILSNGTMRNPEGFISRISSHGQVRLQVSIDSMEPTAHDRNRKKPGLFDRAKRIVELGDRAGVMIDVSTLGIGRETDPMAVAQRVFIDQRAWLRRPFGGVLRIANAAAHGEWGANPAVANEAERSLDGLSPQRRHGSGWCKGFTHPMAINIFPNGEVGNCSLLRIPGGNFGSLRDNSMTEILNGLQDSWPYRLFRSGAVASLAREVDRTLFPGPFTLSCEPVTITLTYARLKENYLRQGVSEDEARAKANQDAAKLLQFTC